MRSLLASLNDHPIALLRGIAELRGLTLTSNNRAEAAAQLAAALAEPAATADTLAACSPAAQRAWLTLKAADRRMKGAIFARAYGEIRPIGPGRLEREAVWQQPANAAEELWYRGLVFRAFADFGDGPLEYFFIPDDLPVPPDLTQPSAAAAPGLPTLPAPTQFRQAFNSLAVDLCTVLAILRDAPVVMERTGELRAGDADRIRAGLLLSDPTRFDLLVSLARGRGWLAPERGRLVVNTQAATAWLRATPWEQMTALFKAWRDSSAPAPLPSAAGSASRAGEVIWNDLRHIPSLRAEGNWQNDPSLARRAVSDSLARLKPGAWHALGDLADWLKTTNPDFQRPDGDYTAWYLRDTATARYLSGFEAWDEVEGRLIRFLVAGPLFWLGAVVLSGEGEEAFRVTRLGAAWLSGTLPADLPRPARLTVGEDFVISAPMLCPLLDRFHLLRFTDPEPAPDEGPALGRPTRHRIHRSSLARARANGVKPEAVLEFLRHATHGRVPPRVTAGLTRWEEQTRLAAAGPRGGGSPVRITRGAVVRVADASILAALRADPVVAPLLGELLSAQAVLVSEANLPRLLAVLNELGYAAQIE